MLLDSHLKPTAERFAWSVAKGMAREIMVWGARGDGKTWAALWAMVMHAIEHHNAGYPLPTSWLGVRDTFRNHVLSTHKSLLGAAWPRDARWSLRDGGLHATFHLEGMPFVELDLIGADSPADAEKVRTECHGLWVDEPAPAMDVASGISDELYYIGCSSQRLETHARVAMLTSNYPDVDHWSAQRFVFTPQPGTMFFRIPKGERASPEYRAELERLYATRPDLARRLVQGQFGSVMLGPQVAIGFNREQHVRPCAPVRQVPLWIGQDAGHTPTTVIGQRVDGRCRVLAALTSEHDGMRGHLQSLVLPWLGEHAPWALDSKEWITVCYDPSTDTDEQANIESNALHVMQQLVPGRYRPGPVSWDGRKDPMLALFNAMARGEPVLQIDPVQAKGLVRALEGGWYYAQAGDGSLRKADTASGSAQPKKPNHPHEDYGDAFCYLVSAMAPTAPERASRKPGWKPGRARVDFSPFTVLEPARGRRQ